MFINEIMREKYGIHLPRGYPVRHKRKIPMEPSVTLSSKYRSLIRQIFEMDSQLDKMILSEADYITLVADAYASNVHWSTRIEGNPLSYEKVKKTSAAVMNSKTVMSETSPGPVQEILNHLYSFFIEGEYDLPWTTDTITTTHRLLMNRTCIDCSPGQFSKKQMCVRNYEGMATFFGCPAEHIEDELDNLVKWVSSSPFDEIVTAVIFFHEFESIHPFSDGNGRTGRTLFQILLKELGLKNINLCMIEEKILSDTELYYALMEYTDDCGDYTVLTEFVVDSLFSAYKDAVDRFSEKDVVRHMDEATKKIAFTAKNLNDWFVLSDAVSWVSGIGEQTVRSKLNSLRELGVLVEEGMTKGRKYRFADPFVEIRKQLNGKTE